jgi:thioredoxin-related protein
VSDGSGRSREHDSSGGIEWLDYDEGMRLVVGSSKFAVIYFDTSDCAPCLWMEDSLFSNPEVIAAIRRDFVPIKVRSARADTVHYQGRTFTESHLRKVFALPGYPMVLFLEGERNQITGGQPSIIRPERFLQYLRYHTSNAYKVVSFDEYLANLAADSAKGQE